ncbi:ATP-binding protein [Geothrix sp. PMB-07]|uniref:ATP-binding protein n=1 Tax=Geothrix sp. PMB-07 TaxID=3068640 RepID=UPI002740731B|nr:ATP-binding protein [Geothrix sp. PMB-07]WLT30084.1 ATP-binding protein [Geothrix sp. PMB-07]
MDAIKLLEELNQVDEHPKLEAKLCNEVGRSIKETISAFSNEPALGGGMLLLGVEREATEDGSPSYVVRGITNPDKIQTDLASACSQAFNVPLRPQIEPAVIDGKVVLCVHVPEANRAEKPIYLKALGISKGTYRRIGSADQVCSDEDLSLLFDGRGSETFDASPVRGATLEDLDPEVIEDYRKIRRERGEDPEVLGWSDEELLDALGCVKDFQGQLTPTVAGIVLFGTKRALRKWFPMMRVDYLRVHGKEWVEDPENRFESLEIREPLFRLIQKTQGVIVESLPKAFSLKEADAQRTDTPTIPIAVIREAVVNALIHRSYRESSPVQVIRYSNRIEIRNPGYSIKSIDRLGEPGSLPRNPHIAQILFEARFAENKGSGIRVMQRLMAGAGLGPPAFESDRENNFFLSTFWLHNLLDEQTIAWLGNFKSFGLSPEETQAIIHARESGAIDNATFRTIALLDTLSASSRLRRLRDIGLLASQAKGAATYYVPTQFLLDPIAFPLRPKSIPIGVQVPLMDLTGGNLIEGEGKPPELNNENKEIGLKSPDLPTKPPELTFESPESPRQWPFQHLGLSLEASIEARRLLDLHRPGKYQAKQKVTQFIYELCLVQPLTADQIATLLRRAKDYVLKDYLTPMVEKGKLAYTLSATPNHPRQAYKSVSRSGKETPWPSTGPE